MRGQISDIRRHSSWSITGTMTMMLLLGEEVGEIINLNVIVNIVVVDYGTMLL